MGWHRERPSSEEEKKRGRREMLEQAVKEHELKDALTFALPLKRNRDATSAAPPPCGLTGWRFGQSGAVTLRWNGTCQVPR
jgi:hypothetical protein